MTKTTWRIVVPLLMLCVATRDSEAQQPLTEFTLEELMRIDAGRVFGASERIQPVTEAPASVSFVTAEEIARHGYRTLADILRATRGLYVTDDRNFSLLGTRGFGKPGDYNSRILLLVNGHRVNDNVFGQAEIGAEFGLDAAMFERVEIIRGPASAIYGDSAFFAVVNVITKSPESIGPPSVTVEAGTMGTQLVRGSTSTRLGQVNVAASLAYKNSNGVERLYFPEFNSPDTHLGVAEGLDGERIGQFYSQATYRDLTVTAAYRRRRRTVPTASFGTLFNEQDWPQQTVDRHTLLDGEYVRAFGRSRVSLRASFDRFTYDGTYPFPPEEENALPLVGQNSVVGARWSAGGRVTHPLPGRQVLTAGAEVIDNIEQNQRLQYLRSAAPVFSIDRSSLQSAVYLQDEVKLTSWLLVNGGARFDRYENFTRLTPRAAVISTPTPHQSFKYLFGSAFRAPNSYETNEFYFGDATESLSPESIDTHEIVWERYTNDWLRTSVSAYWYNANRLITLVAYPSSFLGTTFVNQGEVRAEGLEFEAQMRPRARFQSVFSYAVQRARDTDSGSLLVNSPRHTAKLRASVAGPRAGSTVALDVRYKSARRTLASQILPGVVLTDMAVTAPLSSSLELVGTVRNVFNVKYFEPASDAHRQDAIVQNGRSATIGVRWSLQRK